MWPLHFTHPKQSEQWAAAKRPGSHSGFSVSLKDTLTGAEPGINPVMNGGAAPPPSRSSTGYRRIENAEGNVLIAVYLYACVRVIRISQKVFNRIAWHLVGWLVIIRGPFDSILGSIGSRVKVKVMKRSTSSFYHNAVNFYPIGMQLMPTFS